MLWVSESFHRCCWSFCYLWLYMG